MELNSHTQDETIDRYIERREFQSDPYAFYRNLRSQRPLYKYRDNWLVSGHANVVSILTDSRFAYPDGPTDGGADSEDWESLVTSHADNLVAKIRRKCAHLLRLGISAVIRQTTPGFGLFLGRPSPEKSSLPLRSAFRRWLIVN